MGALARLQVYLQAQYTLPSWTFAKWAQQFPIDLLSIVPGLTVGTTAPVVTPVWVNSTTYVVGEKVDHLGTIYISLANGNLNHTPNVSPTWWQISVADQYPTAAGQSDGEIYLSSSVTPPPSFIWRTGAWYSLSGGSSGGGSYILPPASTVLLGGVYTASTPSIAATPIVMIQQPAVGPTPQYFDAATSRIANVVDPILSQDAATKNYVDSAAAHIHILSEPDAEQAGLYRTTSGGTAAFPTTITWWTDGTATVKVKEITLTYDVNKNITQEVYKFYHSGVLVQTYTDVVTLSGPFEISRVRTIV